MNWEENPCLVWERRLLSLIYKSGLALCLVFYLVPAVAQESGAVTSITDEEIAHESPVDLLSLLRSRVGLDVTGSSITMRGVRGVVFVLDGFTVSVEEVRQVLPQQVRLIEIHRGAASAKYGAEAMGGAVEIFTTKAEVEPSHNLGLGVDSSGSRFARLSGRGNRGSFTFSGLAEHRLVDGYRRVTESPYDYNITVEDERHEKNLLETSFNWREAGNALGLFLKHRNNQSNLGRPNWWWDDKESSMRGTGSWELSSGLRIESRLGWLDYRDEALKDAGTGTSGEGLEPTMRFFTDQTEGDGEFAVELDFEKSTLDGRLSVNRTRRSDRILDAVEGSKLFQLRATTDNLALASGWEGDLPWSHQLQLGLRYDQYRYHGIEIYNQTSQPALFHSEPVTLDAVSGKAAYGWQLLPASRLDFSIGTGFLPPSPQQLYYTELNAASRFIPNPQLDPQHSLTLDAALALDPKAGTAWKLILFYTRWRDKIGATIVDYGTPVVRQYQNIGAAKSNGLELEAEQMLGRRLSLTLNYTYNHTRITENEAHPDYEGNELPNMPRHKLNLGLDWNGSGHWDGRLLFRYVGETWSDEANTAVDSRDIDWRKPGYVTLDVSGVARWKNIELVLAIDNFFDRRYLSGFFWRDEGRIWRIELSMRS